MAAMSPPNEPVAEDSTTPNTQQQRQPEVSSVSQYHETKSLVPLPLLEAGLENLEDADFDDAVSMYPGRRSTPRSYDLESL